MIHIVLQRSMGNAPNTEIWCPGSNNIDHQSLVELISRELSRKLGNIRPLRKRQLAARSWMIYETITMGSVKHILVMY